MLGVFKPAAKHCRERAGIDFFVSHVVLDWTWRHFSYKGLFYALFVPQAGPIVWRGEGQTGADEDIWYFIG